MARVSSSPLAAPRNGATFDLASAELGQLLSRLQDNVLHASPEREQRLRQSEYERARLGTNLEYARASLTKLEQDALGMLAPGRRVEMQADLNKKRELLELLMDRLQDLHKMAVEDDDGSDGEDILADIIPTPSESIDSATEDTRNFTPSETSASEPATAPAPTTEPQPTVPSPDEPPQPTPTEAAPTQTEQILRSRSSATSPPPSHATARAALFANRRRPAASASAPETSTATAEAILDQQAAEREDISNKVYQMAQAMKRQQQNIHDSLESEKDVLGRATEGMERTGRGMEAARGRMGALVRMTEGKGWWGRVILYAWVYGLMLGLLLLVFLMPKLRF